MGLFKKLTGLLFNTNPGPVVTKEGLVIWNNFEKGLDVHSGWGPIAQVPYETWTLVYNNTAETFLNGSSANGVGNFNGTVSITKADSTVHSGVANVLIPTMDIAPGSYGICTTFGLVRGINTTLIPGVGPLLYVDPDNPGKLTRTRPEFPNYRILVGAVTTEGTTDGVLTINIKETARETLFNISDGSIRETFDFKIKSDGVKITGTLTNRDFPSSDLTLVMSDGLDTFDTTTVPAEIDLTPGSATVAQSNYVYIDKATKTLMLATSDWPITEEHARVAHAEVFTVSRTAHEGAYRNQNWNDHIKTLNDNGHLLHMAEAIRDGIPAKHKSGTAGSLSFGPSNETWAAATGGVVKQLHRQSFPIKDMTQYTIDGVNQGTKTFTISDDGDLSSSFIDDRYIQVNNSTGNNKLYTIASTSYSAPDFFVIVNETIPDATVDGTIGDTAIVLNDFTTPNIPVTNLKSITTDASGNALLNTSFSIVMAGVVNLGGEPSQIVFNFPTDTYNKNFPDQAVQDASNYSVYSNPQNLDGVYFLIARFTIVDNGGSWSLYDTEDLRGKIANTTAGGGAGGAGVTEWTSLTDTPSSYIGQARKQSRVNLAETGLEFFDEENPTTKAYNQASHGLSLLNSIYNNGTIWVQAKADDPDTLGLLIVTKVIDVDNFEATQAGFKELTAHGLTVGQYYFTSDTVAGQLTSTAPSEYVNPLLFVIDANSVLVLPFRPNSVGAPTPAAHASSHTDGTDDIQSATNSQKGLATAAHISAIEANTAASHGVNDPNTSHYTKAEADALHDAALKAPEAYDPSVTGNYPLTYDGGAISKSDSFRIIANQIDIGDGGRSVNIEDLLIALVDTPSATVATDWMVAESNRDQATETTLGVVEIATQSEVDTGSDDLRAITSLKLANRLIPYKIDSSIISRTQATHGFSVNDAIYHTGSAWAKSDASDITKLGFMIVVAVADVNNFTAVQVGVHTVTSHGLTVGEYYFVSETTAGLLTTTEPIGADFYSNPLVYVEDANTIIVLPYRPSPTPTIIKNKTTVTTASYTIQNSDDVIDVEYTAGICTLTLPVVSDSIGQEFTVVKNVKSAYKVLVDGNGSETIQSRPSDDIWLYTNSATYFNNGTEWEIIYSNVYNYSSSRTYLGEPTSLATRQINGGITKVATGSTLQSGTPINVSVNCGYIMVVAKTQTDVAGTINVAGNATTGYQVNKSTGAETVGASENIVLTQLATDNTTTDSNGNTKYDIANFLMTENWYRGDIIISTTDVDITADIYVVNFENQNDVQSLMVETLDVKYVPTNVAFETSLYLYKLTQGSGDEHSLTSMQDYVVEPNDIDVANVIEQRRYVIEDILDGTTEGYFAQLTFSDTATYVIDFEMNIWVRSTHG